MNKSFLITIICAIALIFHQSALATSETDSLISHKLSDRILLVTGGAFSSNQVIIKTDEGIILIDSGDSPEYGEKLKKIIEESFGSIRVKYIFNTHHHLDHTGGNSSFPDAKMITHENFHVFRDSTINISTHKENQKPINETSDEIKKELPPPPPPLSNQPYDIPDKTFTEKKIEYLSPFPDFTFSDRLTFFFDSISVELYYYGICHTDNDIIIYIPQEGVLVTGDLFYKKQLPHLGSRTDLQPENWLQVLNELLSDSAYLKTIVPGHFEVFSKDELINHRDYLQYLLQEISQLVDEGADLERTITELSDLVKLPDFQGKDVFDNKGNSLHIQNIKYMWYSLIK